MIFQQIISKSFWIRQQYHFNFQIRGKKKKKKRKENEKEKKRKIEKQKKRKTEKEKNKEKNGKRKEKENKGGKIKKNRRKKKNKRKIKGNKKRKSEKGITPTFVSTKASSLPWAPALWYYGFAGPQRRASGMGSKEFKVGLKIQSKLCLLRPKLCANTP